VDILYPSTTVLFIDANKEDRQSWVQRLHISSPEYVVLEADNGAAGLAICQSQRIDCVVSELSLPDMSGFEILIKLIPLAHRPGIAVIVLTGLTLGSPSLAALSRINGAQAYMIKSRTSGDELDLAIHKALAHIGPVGKDRHD
jgi:DNA-binding NarL/FixJ family response regulator